MRYFVLLLCLTSWVGVFGQSDLSLHKDSSSHEILIHNKNGVAICTLNDLDFSSDDIDSVMNNADMAPMDKMLYQRILNKQPEDKRLEELLNFCKADKSVEAAFLAHLDTRLIARFGERKARKLKRKTP